MSAITTSYLHKHVIIGADPVGLAIAKALKLHGVLPIEADQNLQVF